MDPQRLYKNEGLVSVNSIASAKKRLDRKFEKRQEGEMGYPDRRMAELIDPVMYEEFFGLREANIKYLRTILEKSGYDKERIGFLDFVFKVFSKRAHCPSMSSISLINTSILRTFEFGVF